MPDEGGARWATLKDASGREYIYNEDTKETRWLWTTHTDPGSKRQYRANALTRKTEWLLDSSSADGASAEVVCTATDGRRYVYNKITKESRWLPSHMSPRRPTLAPGEAAGVLGRAFRSFRAKIVLLKMRFVSANLNATMDKLREGTELDIQKLSEETNALFALSQIDSGSEQHRKLRELHKRLIAAGEVITQGTIAVDGVSSEGSDIVRARRRVAIKTLLALGDRTDQLKARTYQRLQEIPEAE